jgi:hypothetical protein
LEVHICHSHSPKMPKQILWVYAKENSTYTHTFQNKNHGFDEKICVPPIESPEDDFVRPL